MIQIIHRVSSLLLLQLEDLLDDDVLVAVDIDSFGDVPTLRDDELHLLLGGRSEYFSVKGVYDALHGLVVAVPCVVSSSRDSVRLVLPCLLSGSRWFNAV